MCGSTRALSELGRTDTTDPADGGDAATGTDVAGATAAQALERSAQRAARMDRYVTDHASNLDRRQLARDLDRFAADHDAGLLAGRERRAHNTRHLSLSPDPANPPRLLLHGSLGVLDGAQLRGAVDALAKRAGPDDTRDPGQRRADALVELVARGAIADAARVLLITTPDALHDTPDAAPSTLDGVGHVSNDTARQACCDATLTDVTMRN